jgi:hypothetical protein
MENNGMPADAAGPAPPAQPVELAKELAQLRARLAEIASMLRNTYGSESIEAQLAGEISAAVQRLEARLAGCVSAHFES